MATNDLKTGHIVEVIGPVVDIQFEEGHLPFINNAVRITSQGFNNPEPLDIVAEVDRAEQRLLSVLPIVGRAPLGRRQASLID